ncbi:AAA family ATPase [Lysinibacillus capsici]|uniref:ATP-binding protein n=1 Tax=Lysinibacillus TaxID=400634 RepID=UPI000652D87A|nr:ATP-binding protein [Lysinibacillus sp. LK3]KMN39468.1 cell division protein [Lysinibacillus sp. LK3]
MDKIKWLQQMVDQNPNDSQGYLWLGKELADHHRWLEAVQTFSTGLSHCTDEALQKDIIDALTKASLQIQQGASLPNDNEDQVASAIVDDYVATIAEEEQDHLEGCSDIQLDNRKVKNLEPKFKVIEGDASKKAMKKVNETVTFADVAGLDDLKKTINLRIISPFYNKGLFAKFRKKIGGGVLLYGPPGCGKTYIAKATAGECKANFYPVHITDILDPYIGVSEQNLKAIFDKARFQKPSIMFFDEVDTIGMSRSQTTSHVRGIIDTFLTEMEGVDTNNDEVLVMAATNTPWDVDSALKRPGRFDRLIFVAPPDEKARAEIFNLKLKGRFVEKIDTTVLAAKTQFFSGADIANVVELATENVLEEILLSGNERPINTNDLVMALQELQPSTLDWLRTAKNYVKYANQSGLYNDVEKYLRAHARYI